MADPNDLKTETAATGVDTAEHLRVWNSRRTVSAYRAVERLEPAEQAIADRLAAQLPGMRMLDMGIGAGRTTLYFAHRVAHYVGMDYAAGMIEACRKRFPDRGPTLLLEVMDATCMPEVADASFDFTLFSFNGVDCVPPADRDKVFHEAYRVTRPGGWFAFSTHNLRYMPRLYSFRGRKGLRAKLYHLYRVAMMYRYNGAPARYRDKNIAVLRDGIERFALGICYVRPEWQMQQLRTMGFSDVEAISIHTGATIPERDLPGLTGEAWIYYLCRR